jgi:hypothetical protein
MATSLNAARPPHDLKAPHKVCTPNFSRCAALERLATLILTVTYPGLGRRRIRGSCRTPQIAEPFEIPAAALDQASFRMDAVKRLPYRFRADIFLQLYRLEAVGLAYDRAVAVMKLPSPAAPRDATNSQQHKCRPWFHDTSLPRIDRFVRLLLGT